VPEYLEAITEDDDEDGGLTASSGGSGGSMEDSDDPYDQAVAVVLRDGKASTSYIQRRLGIGYNRAASLIERMEEEGVIGPANHAGKREILVPTEDAAAGLRGFAGWRAWRAHTAQRVADHFASVKTMTGEFIQFGPNGEQTGGKFFIDRPGKLRFNYEAPSAVRVIADGKKQWSSATGS
jgi:hypothetical protein